MKTRFIGSLLILIGLGTSAYSQVENRSSLKIKDFMALNYQGQSPGQFQWSPDSKYLYFQWNADNKPADSAYRIDPSNPVLHKVSRGDLQKLRPADKNLNSDKSMEIINKNGDIYLVNCKKQDTVLAFGTSMAVSDVSFTHSGKKLILTINNNLYLIFSKLFLSKVLNFLKLLMRPRLNIQNFNSFL